MIDLHEGRNVAVYEISGAYLSADMGEEVIMILEGRLLELMGIMAPEIYQRHIHVKKIKRYFI